MREADSLTARPDQLPPDPEPGSTEQEHHSAYCPNCSERLWGLRCKLICSRCGYYLSCADYY